MSILVCGSIAYDSIMVFPGQFKNHILPDQVHILSVCFQISDMRKEYGGSAGNIAYNLKLLNAEPLIMATVGDDAGAYGERLDKLGLSRSCIRHIPGSFTAQAFIMTDHDDNQITAFHPGAMDFAHQNRVDEVTETISIGIIAPDGRTAMMEHAEQFAEKKIPFVFDPGQGLPMFSGAELVHFLKLADYCIVNDYEAKMLCDSTGWSLPKLAEEVEALIVTRGANGSTIYSAGESIEIPCAKVNVLIDPTGCGDAYRAGLLYGISRKLSWQQTGRLGAVMGAIKIEHRGGQNHNVSLAEIAQRYEQSFGERLEL